MLHRSSLLRTTTLSLIALSLLSIGVSQASAQEVLMRLGGSGYYEFYDPNVGPAESAHLGEPLLMNLPQGRSIVGAWLIDRDAGLYGLITSNGQSSSALMQHTFDLSTGTVDAGCAIASGASYNNVVGVDRVDMTFPEGVIKPSWVVSENGTRTVLTTCAFSGTPSSQNSPFSGEHVTVTGPSGSPITAGPEALMYLPDAKTLHRETFSTFPTQKTSWTFNFDGAHDMLKWGNEVFGIQYFVSLAGPHAHFTWYLNRATLGASGTESEWSQVGTPIFDYETFYFEPDHSYLFMLSDMDVAASDGTSMTSVAVSWDDVHWAQSYRVLRRPQGSSTSPTAISGWLTATSFTDFSATAGFLYEYFVEGAVDENDSATYVMSDGDIGYRCTSAPTLTALQSKAPCAGDDVTFTAIADGGSHALAYEWKHDGDVIAGATSDKLTLTNVTGLDSGTYSVVVTYASGLCGSATSTATLDVLADPVTGASATLGTSTSKVTISWNAVADASYYRVDRSDDANGLNRKAISDWLSSATTWFDDDLDGVDEPIPGHCYYYTIVVGDDAKDVCGESTAVAGLRALSPPSTTYATDGQHSSFVEIQWAPAEGGVHYQILRSTVDDLETANRIHTVEWLELGDIDDSGPTATPLVFRDYSAVSFVNYFYWILSGPGGASANEIALKASLAGMSEPGFRTCEDLATTGSCTPDGVTLTNDLGAVLVIVLDRSQHMANDCATSLATAMDDIENFSLIYPEGRIAVWTFSETCVSNLTGGYTSREHAEFVVDSLADAECVGTAPLADALWMAIQDLRACTLFAPDLDLHISLHTAGIRDSYVPGAFMDGKPDATSGSDCSSFEPIGVAWQSWVCATINSPHAPTVNVHNWVSTDPMVTNTALFTSLAAQTGGVHDEIPTGSPPSTGFFPDCNGNGIDDDLDVALGTSADCDGDGAPDECQAAQDCDLDGIPDSCEIVQGLDADLNGNGLPDSCEGLTLTLPSASVAGLPLSMQVVEGSPNSLVVLVAGFVEGSIPTPGCPGTSIGIADFASYGAPLLIFLPTDNAGQIGLDIPIPASASGVEVLFQVVDPGACALDDVERVILL